MRTLNQAEAEGWSEEVRRHIKHIVGLGLLVLLMLVLLISAWLFVTEN